MHNFNISSNITLETKYAFQYFLESLKDTVENKTIQIYINSYGGDTNVTLWIIKQLSKLRTKGFSINTIGQDKVASSAALIFIFGDKRTITQATEILFHRTSSKISIETRLREDTDISKIVNSENFIKAQKSIIKDNMFIINLIDERTSIDKQLFYQIEDKTLDANKALKLKVASHVVNSILTFNEKEWFAKKYIEIEEFPFKILEKIKNKLTNHLNNYLNGIFTKEECYNLCLWDLRQIK